MRPTHDGRFHDDGFLDNRQVSANAAIEVSKLAGGSNGQVVKTVGGVPAWVDATEGVENLDDLGDVAITSPTTGQVLRYTGTGFANSAIGAGDLPSGIDAAKIGGGAVSNAEFSYLDGVSGAIQTQLDGKAATNHTHSATAITSGTLDTARLPSGIDASLLAGGGVSNTEFGYLDGVTGSIQAQLNAKQAAIVAIQEEPAGTKDGVNATFTLSASPTWGTLIWEGVSLRWGVDFSVSGSTITILDPDKPTSGDDLWFAGLGV